MYIPVVCRTSKKTAEDLEQQKGGVGNHHRRGRNAGHAGGRRERD